MVEPRQAPSNSCGVKIALAPLEGCRSRKDGGHEPLGVHCSILQEICSAQVGKEMLDEIQRWNQQEVPPEPMRKCEKSENDNGEENQKLNGIKKHKNLPFFGLNLGYYTTCFSGMQDFSAKKLQNS